MNHKCLTSEDEKSPLPPFFKGGYYSPPLEKGDLGGFEVFHGKACGYKNNSFVAACSKLVFEGGTDGLAVSAPAQARHIFRASAIRLSRNLGWASLTISTALSQVDFPIKLTAPYSVTR